MRLLIYNRLDAICPSYDNFFTPVMKKTRIENLNYEEEEFITIFKINVHTKFKLHNLITLGRFAEIQILARRLRLSKTFTFSSNLHEVAVSNA